MDNGTVLTLSKSTNESTPTIGDEFDENLLKSSQPWRMGFLDDPKYPAYGFENHDNFAWRKYVWEHPYYPYIACVLYVATIFGLQAYMKNRPPMKLRTALIFWNWALGLFSIMGFSRILPEFVDILRQENGLHSSVCGRDDHHIPAAFWGLLFTFSKYAELGDTIFIVLKKQPLLALQWYHHCLVTVFAWVMYGWQEQVLRWFSLMNYGIHAIMYPYFALRGMNIKVPEIFAMSITTMQVAQMIAGVAINVYSAYVWGKGEECGRHPHSVAFSFFTYFSLWILFAQFFIAKYISRTRKKNKAE